MPLGLIEYYARYDMKPLSTINITADNGILVQQVVRRGLIALSLAIIFLSGAAIWTVVQLTDFYNNKVQILAEQEKLLHSMRIAARERTLLLYALVTEEDPFLRDDHRMAFYSAGAKFAQSRLKLTQTPLDDNELQILDNQGKITGLTRPAQEQVLDLVMDDESKLALALLRGQAIPGQNQVMQRLDQLNMSIDRRYSEATTKADSIGKASIIILVAIVFIFILGAAYIIRQTTYRSYNLITQLSETREMALRSQKMEALGKLTGGIAHDYNNMLGVILGFSELLENMLVDQPKLAEYAHHIRHAADRGAKLTKKLLAFTRHKSSNEERLIINTLLQYEKDMLEKTLTARIKLEYKLTDDLWPVWLDSSELEDVIINLSINAMHAIDGNGQVTIQARNTSINDMEAKTLQLEPGDYVLLSLTDTGCGMDATTKEKMFDPFYSTKGEQGTGLGLSQAYGFVQRSNGAINVYSEPGRGTRLNLYFPRYNENDSDDKSVKDTQVVDLSGKEVIMVVDDEPALLGLTSEILRQQGYRVACADSGKQALDILENKSIDLLLSDVIMPEMDGYQLAETVKKKYPAIKIQLASGFNDEHNANLVDDDLRKMLLHKPYDSKTLLLRIRELLA